MSDELTTLSMWLLDGLLDTWPLTEQNAKPQEARAGCSS